MNKFSLVILLSLVFFFAPFNSIAQKKTTTTKSATKIKSQGSATSGSKTKTSINKSELTSQPLSTPEKMPRFPGGNEALEKYFNNALAGMAIKQPAGITLQLLIDQTGKVTKATINNGYKKYENGLWLEYPEIDKEIERSALQMPAWEPGYHQGKPVSVQRDFHFTLMAPGQPIENEELIFVSVEKLPEFPGGNAQMMEYIKTNLKYPEDMKPHKLEGLVVVQFVVTRFGDIKEAKILKGLSPSMDAETLRLVSEMPQWTPGRQNGNPVSVRYTLPVRFTL